MGLEVGGEDYVALTRYVSEQRRRLRSKVYRVLWDTEQGLVLYRKHGSKEMAIERMGIDFENHVDNMGQPSHVDGEVYISIMSKILDQIVHLSYQSIQKITKEIN